ncbi:hypothetical protein DFH09DRAFT_1076743 [Mycena vulgaris]|nr:hypothetical protein DFH09DRAFT_1076743 [Mycena vulgaris]
MSHIDIDTQGSSSDGYYQLICGAESGPLIYACEAYAPQMLPASSIAPLASARRTLPPTRKSNGCGTPIHIRARPNASPSGSKSWYTSQAGVSSTVIPLDAKYFLDEVTQALILVGSDSCGRGCQISGVGCAVCGNALGFFTTPCQWHETAVNGKGSYTFFSAAVSPPFPDAVPRSTVLSAAIRERDTDALLARAFPARGRDEEIQREIALREGLARARGMAPPALPSTPRGHAHRPANVPFFAWNGASSVVNRAPHPDADDDEGTPAPHYGRHVELWNPEEVLAFPHRTVGPVHGPLLLRTSRPASDDALPVPPRGHGRHVDLEGPILSMEEVVASTSSNTRLVVDPITGNRETRVDASWSMRRQAGHGHM